MKCETCEHCGGISWRRGAPSIDCRDVHMISIEAIDAVIGCMWYKARRDADGDLITVRQGKLFGDVQ